MWLVLEIWPFIEMRWKVSKKKWVQAHIDGAMRSRPIWRVSRRHAQSVQLQIRVSSFGQHIFSKVLGLLILRTIKICNIQAAYKNIYFCFWQQLYQYWRYWCSSWRAWVNCSNISGLFMTKGSDMILSLTYPSYYQYTLQPSTHSAWYTVFTPSTTTRYSRTRLHNIQY
jgi:hypothetical protein